jgi:hypothetical protein
VSLICLLLCAIITCSCPCALQFVSVPCLLTFFCWHDLCLPLSSLACKCL